MAEILGLGLTHSPSLIKPDEGKGLFHRKELAKSQPSAGTEDSHQLAGTDAH